MEINILEHIGSFYGVCASATAFTDMNQQLRILHFGNWNALNLSL